MWEFIKENLEVIFSGIGVLIIASLWKSFLVGLKQLLRYFRIHRVPIYIKINSTELPRGSQYKLLIVKRGGFPDEKDGLNKELTFKNVDYRGTYRVKVNCLKRHGFIFKCLLDYGNLSFSLVKSKLEKEGFTDISKAKGMPQRVFFILPEYPTHKERYLNNQFLPS